MLKWNPNSEINLAGYRVYFGMVSKLYKSFVDVGKATQYALGNLSESTTYFFSVTAYNFDGVESAPSDELVFYADDGIPSYRDNCPADYNPGQEDTFPPNGNEIGDACDCEADFNCDGGVDAHDVISFLDDFGRNQYERPCTSQNPCNGDFNCDGNVDANDLKKFSEDFARSQFNNPCPSCTPDDWCSY